MTALDPNRTTPHGMWRFGATYTAAGLAVVASDKDRLLVPALQLFGHSIELLLKAFLLKRGMSLQDLKRMSHGLDGLLKEARRRRLGAFVKFSKRELEFVALLNQSYSSTRLRYIVAGPVSLPPLEVIEAISKRLARGLENYCTGAARSVFQHAA